MKMARSPCFSVDPIAAITLLTNTPYPISNSLTQREEDAEHVQVLDDLLPTSIIEEVIIARPPDKLTRRIEAAHQTWTAINSYIQHNYLEKWIPRMTTYFNKFTNFGDDIWDSPRPDDA